MVGKEDLKDLLNLSNRIGLFEKILKKLKKFADLENVNYYEFKTSEGIIPIIIIAKSSIPEEIKYVKVFVGAQHNEYNGLFGIIEFLNLLEKSILSINEILNNNQILILAPLMNPYGFLNPRKDNKSGYYLKDGTNLNRYWRRAFAPEYTNGEGDLGNHPIPENTKVIKKLLEEFWGREEIQVFIIDFHETSLLERFLEELNRSLKKDSTTYKFNHWLKEGIVYNVIKLYNLKFTKKPLFYRCNPKADHTHINLTVKQLDLVCEKLQEYISNNNGKLQFYFCYSNRSKEFCKRIAQNTYNNLKNILWETYFPAFDHSFNDHGCFVNMNDVIKRKGVYSMELESPKQFFNIFDEIEKSKTDLDYFNQKISVMNMNIKLVVESIKEMVKFH
ncbi:MAG: hypothetical protein KGD65_01135 [Candidatus Lokiarchaeota archaeon]|nr:hypothetical protein [Candidatus Lokiarchaeota archaeon]